MKVLVVGGAGYIGSHMVKVLYKEGFEVIALDNLSTGNAALGEYGSLIVGDMGDAEVLESIFNQYRFDAVIHFAASSQVGESIQNPIKYYKNNVAKSMILFEKIIENGIKNIIFSSTAAVFGEPEYVPIDEDHPRNPINPYGKSKLIVEEILEDLFESNGINSVSLRYFNACGADPEGEFGECHDPETHLIPLALKAAMRDEGVIKIFGNDYNTDDGTCIRDYIHVNDLCDAHLKSLKYLLDGNLGAHKFNLGNGCGYSVQKIIDEAKNVVKKDGLDIEIEYVKRRLGDPEVLISDSEKAINILKWKPNYTAIKIIIEHAWAWEKNQK